MQQILRRNGRNGGSDVRDSYGTLLKGLLRCAFCNSGMVRRYTTHESLRHRAYACVGSQQECHTRPVSEATIKVATTQQIRGIGSDPRVLAHAVIKVEEQRRLDIANLILEREVTQRVLDRMMSELCKMDFNNLPVPQRVADLQEGIGQAERRLSEIVSELESLESLVVDEGDLRAALAQFVPVWEFLNLQEQARIIRALVDGIACNGERDGLRVHSARRGFAGCAVARKRMTATEIVTIDLSRWFTAPA